MSASPIFCRADVDLHAGAVGARGAAVDGDAALPDLLPARQGHRQQPPRKGEKAVQNIVTSVAYHMGFS